MGTVNGVIYPVTIELSTTGDVAGGSAGKGGDALEKLSKAQDKLKDGASDLVGSYIDFGKGAIGAFTGIMDSAVDLGSTLLKIGGTAAFGAMTVGVVGLNKELENTKMSIASILEVQGFAPNISAGLEQSGHIMTKMRKDAAELPGEFSDLINIFRTIATPGSNAGMSVERLEALSAKAMAAGAVMQLPSAMVGREMAMAMDGRVGAHNIFATRLGIQGDEATKFRALSAPKKAEYIEEKLGKYQGAIDAFKTSYEAASSTAVDNGKKFLSDATEPLFERVKKGLQEFNNWFDQNQDTVSLWGLRIGNGLEAAFDKGKAIVLEYGPLLMDFAGDAFQRLKDTWAEIKPMAESIGASIKEALKDPGTLDRIILALKLYGAIKIGGGIMDAVGGPLGGILSAGGALGKIGGGVAEAAGMASGSSGLGGFANGAAAVGGADMLGGMEGLAASAGGAAVSLGALAIAAASAYLVYEAYTEYQDVIKETTRMHEDQIKMLVKNAGAWDDWNGEIDINSKMFNQAIENMTDNMSLFDQVSAAAASAMYGTATLHAQIRSELESEAEKLNFRKTAEANGPNYGAEASAYIGVMATMGLNKPDEKKKKGVPAGSGTTNVTVYMTVSSNQAPGQIARRVVDILAEKARNPTGSRGAFNATNARR